MSARRFKFAAALAAFLLWLGWLGYLVAHQSREVILSRPQLLAANHLVYARVEAAPDGKPELAVVVQQVVAGGDDLVAPQKMLIVDGLAEASGFHGAGMYLLPLSRDRDRDRDDVLRVTRIPQSPGFDPYHIRNRAQIYPWSPGVEAQARGIRPH
jgi:hypothetical protein